MQIYIAKKNMKNVAETIGTYIFKDLRTTGKKDMDWLCSVCNFYRDMEETGADDAETTSVSIDRVAFEIDAATAKSVRKMISEYLFQDISDMSEDDINWLCEMTYIYQQLAGTSNTKAKKTKDDTEIHEQEVGDVDSYFTSNDRDVEDPQLPISLDDDTLMF